MGDWVMNRYFFCGKEIEVVIKIGEMKFGVFKDVWYEKALDVCDKEW